MLSKLDIRYQDSPVQKVDRKESQRTCRQTQLCSSNLYVKKIVSTVGYKKYEEKKTYQGLETHLRLESLTPCRPPFPFPLFFSCPLPARGGGRSTRSLYLNNR
jgi:hypothetical protein